MPVRITVNVTGNTANRYDVLRKRMLDEIDDELTAEAFSIKREADTKAPKYEGGLRAHIDNEYLNKEISYPQFYAPYIEFGTGSKVIIPPSYEEYAKQFKGPARRGNVQDFFKEMVLWVKRKGLAGRYSTKTRRRLGSKAKRESEDREVAYAIMHHILTFGVTPHPFFIPAFTAGKDKVLRRLRTIINKYSG